MNVSIIIPNHSDLRMEKMINSIDYRNNESHSVELVIVLNCPTKDVIEQTRRIQKELEECFFFKIVTINHCNLGLAYNVGLQNASFSNVMFIDTDLICDKGAIENTINSLAEDIDIVKAKVVYKNMSKFVEGARLVNTTLSPSPYIPVVLFRKSLFNKLNGDYCFAVDTVWCSDAEFANRVVESNANIKYIDYFFFHDLIGIKKDLKDACLYGFGKGIRLKRTKEKWSPYQEIKTMAIESKNCGLNIPQIIYSTLWITLQQITCGLQLHMKPFFSSSLSFEKSMKKEELNKFEV